jgi:hypothetical protein
MALACKTSRQFLKIGFIEHLNLRKIMDTNEGNKSNKGNKSNTNTKRNTKRNKTNKTRKNKQMN